LPSKRRCPQTLIGVILFKEGGKMLVDTKEVKHWVELIMEKNEYDSCLYDMVDMIELYENKKLMKKMEKELNA